MKISRVGTQSVCDDCGLESHELSVRTICIIEFKYKDIPSLSMSHLYHSVADDASPQALESMEDGPNIHDEEC